MSREADALRRLTDRTQHLLLLCAESPELGPPSARVAQITAIRDQLTSGRLAGALPIYAAIRSDGLPLGRPWPPDGLNEDEEYRATVIEAFLRSWIWAMEEERGRLTARNWGGWDMVTAIRLLCFWAVMMGGVWLVWIVIEGLVRFILRGGRT